MTEERAPHTQEPAEGAEENVPTPGAERADEGDGGTNGGSGAEEGAAQHPQEPAEGGEDKVEG